METLSKMMPPHSRSGGEVFRSSFLGGVEGKGPRLVARRPTTSRVGHFLSHREEQAAILSIHTAEQAAKLTQKASIFTSTAPGDVVRPLGKIRQLGRLLAIVEKLVHGNFHGAGQFLQRFDGRDRMTVFNAGDIASKQSRLLLDVPLREVFFLSHGAQSISDNHVAITSYPQERRIEPTLDLNQISRKLSSVVSRRPGGSIRFNHVQITQRALVVFK